MLKCEYGLNKYYRLKEIFNVCPAQDDDESSSDDDDYFSNICNIRWEIYSASEFQCLDIIWLHYMVVLKAFTYSIFFKVGGDDTDEDEDEDEDDEDDDLWRVRQC